jgi:hypothetical protein
LGSNQRRLSRRFYRLPAPPSASPVVAGLEAPDAAGAQRRSRVFPATSLFRRQREVPAKSAATCVTGVRRGHRGRLGTACNGDFLHLLEHLVADREIVPLLTEAPKISAKCALLLPVVRPLAWSDSTTSSTPLSRRCRFFTICRSNVPCPSRGTLISTGPECSVSTVFDRVPLRMLPVLAPTGSCFSLPGVQFSHPHVAVIRRQPFRRTSARRVRLATPLVGPFPQRLRPLWWRHVRSVH